MSHLALLVVALGCGRDRPADTRGASPEPRPEAGQTKVDVHMHVALDAVDDALAVMAEQQIVVGLNASGGAPGQGLEQSAAVTELTGGRLLPLCNLPLSPLDEPGFADYAARTLEECRRLGARGLKVSKYLGLGLTDAAGHLVPVDDPRLDVVFESAGRLGLPVLIHSGDPRAFFAPPTPDNERYDELRVHPGWSFYGHAPSGEPWPSWNALLEQHERRVARHPGTQFLGAHFGNAAEDPDRVQRMLEKYPNYFIDTAARVPEFGRHPATRMRAFFVAHQDRILFGSDLGVGRSGLVLGSGGEHPGTRAEARVFFERHWAYFETNTRAMAHPTPIQGHWTVDGIGLPKPVLRKLYADNARRLFRLEGLH
jgi:predicted TIM-barrel fold metal-dependent hydrolase